MNWHIGSGRDMDVGALVNNQYKIIEHIGRGGMADVWSARDTRLRRMVAIKTIVAGLSKDIDPVELFKREAHTIAQMEHPHILPIYDFGEYEHNLYIVMRYITGGSLEDTLRDGPMSPEDVLRMGEAIGQALDYAHSNNVIHLDLKPPNILLDSTGSPYLADFGLATVLDPEGRARNPGSGTLLYMAPEQMISDMIDHRADIYSFSIMLFHMLTGHLPFDGNIPLSMSQVQRDIGLPSLQDQIGYLPDDLTDLLRLGTSEMPKYRPETHMEIMDQFRNILQPAGISIGTDSYDSDYQIEADPYNMLTEPYDGDIEDADLLEAVDVYSRARYDWQGGQGRFLLGVTNFILMSDYYQNADMHNLSIDKAGYQVLLRGAIEYDYELDYWWQMVNDDDRRWVCLHALRSGNTPARIRSLYRLETLPDEEGTAVIPRLVAQALEVESDESAKLAALTVMGTRARLMKKRPQMQIMTEYRGRLISSMTRLGIEIVPPTDWQEAIYSEDVDVLVAEQAFDSSAAVAEFAARTVGKMRSLAAVEHLSGEQKNQRKGALQALAFVRDESPNLPDIVSREARFYAWIANTVRRLTERPMEVVANIAMVFIMGWIAMGTHVYGAWGVLVGSVTQQRWTNAIGFGVIFGLVTSLTYILTVLISQRLQGFWSWWMRLLLSSFLGFGMGTLFFASYRFFILQENARLIAWDEMRFAGAAFAFGLVMTVMLRLRAWQGVLLTSALAFGSIFAIYRSYYFADISTMIPIAIIVLLVGLACGWRISQLSSYQLQSSLRETPISAAIAGIVFALIWVIVIWATNFNQYNALLGGTAFDWNAVLTSAFINVLFGLLIGYWLHNSGRISFALTALVGFVAVYAVTGWVFFDHTFDIPYGNPNFEVLYYDSVPFVPVTLTPFIDYNFNNLNQIFTLTLPFVIVIALGMNLPALLSGWWNWIGKPRGAKERGAWMTGTLGYMMVLTVLVSILTLFSPDFNRVWELSWSFWAFVTFVLLMATYRWTKWGARGLIISGLLLLVGGIAFDGVAMYQQALGGNFPSLLSPVPQISEALQQIRLDATVGTHHFWGIWAVVLAIFIWGAQRRLLWGGIGLVTMLIAWYIVVFTMPIRGSIAIFAATNVALLFFVLESKYELMEASRLKLPYFMSGTQGSAEVAGVPETIVGLPDIDLPAAPATQIITGADIYEKPVAPDLMQTNAPSIDAMRHLDTVDFDHVPAVNTNDMTTQAPIEINTEDLYTQVPSQSEFVEFDDDRGLTDMKINLDTSAIIAKEDNLSGQSGLSDIKINLDTSALRPKNDDVEDELDETDMKINLDTSALFGKSGDTPKEKSSGESNFSLNLDTSTLKKNDEAKPSKSGLSDIKINLDTSALNKKVNDTKTETSSKTTFKFDGSTVSDKKQHDEEEDE